MVKCSVSTQIRFLEINDKALHDQGEFVFIVRPERSL